jgi:hypothetical protein
VREKKSRATTYADGWLSACCQPDKNKRGSPIGTCWRYDCMLFPKPRPTTHLLFYKKLEVLVITLLIDIYSLYSVIYVNPDEMPHDIVSPDP